jgi:uncharacterized membrane protein YGL010W
MDVGHRRNSNSSGAAAGPRRRLSWPELMVTYRESHRHPGTRLTHMFGIPMIVTSLVLAPFRPWLALQLFVGGWVLQFVGHYVFEKNDPQFFGDKRNLLVGVLWSAIEWMRLLTGRWREHRSRR